MILTVRTADAKPRAWTVSIVSDRFGSRKRPVWKRPFSSVLTHVRIPSLGCCSTTTVASATGRPSGLSTVPASETPGSITCTLVSARASAAEMSRSTVTWSGCSI